MIRRFTIEESCIAMVLWHDYDTALREGATRVCVTVKNLNDSFAAKLKGVKLPTRGGMKAALQLFHRHRLIRLNAAEDFADSTIEILHTLRLVMPFQQLVYRQLLYLVTIQSVITALLGTRQRWQVMHRAGTFAADEPEPEPAPAVARPTRLVSPNPRRTKASFSDGWKRRGVKPAACSAGQKRLPGRAKWLPVAAE